ncbi:MAG: cupin domain-containing protein [Pseudomonadota bacterium]
MFFSIGILTPAAADVAPDYARVVELLETSETIVGEPIAYPDDGPAVVTSLIVTMMPGEETGWHEHDVPTYGYILEGQVTVDYGDEGDRTYQAGDAFRI